MALTKLGWATVVSILVWIAIACIFFFLTGCSTFDPSAVDEVVGLTPDEKGVLCVKASIVKGSSRLDYNRLEISNSENVASITAEQIQAACPK